MLLDINRDTVGMELHVPLVELEIAYEKPLSQDPNGSTTHYHDDLMAYLQRHIVVLSPDGKSWQVEVMDVERGDDQTPPYQQQPTPYVDAHVRLTTPTRGTGTAVHAQQ